MGEWVYYAAAMRIGDVATRVKLAEDIHSSTSLNTMIQRALDRRSADISDYLTTQSRDRFFNSIVVGVYGGDPEWLDLRVEDNPILSPSDIPSSVSDSLGVLRLTGSERLFALDGQHRVVGIREAIHADKHLADEQIVALFVSHQRTPMGLRRTRRLFTTLNRYAKPVNKKDLIALDEDDTVAIVTRRLVDEHPLFIDKISVTHTKSMPTSAVNQFTSIVALYDALDIYLADIHSMKGREWKRFKRFRKPDDDIDSDYKNASRLFDRIAGAFEEVAEMRSDKGAGEIAGKYRNRAGGHLLFRPIGLSMLVRVLKALRAQGLGEIEAIRAIADVPMRLDSPPWAGLLWDVANHRMIVRSENQTAAARLMFHGAGGDLRTMNSSVKKLGDELAGLMNQPKRVEVRRYGR